jgi:hypothetical protein
MVVLRIYVEGGGQRKGLRSECREGFTKFIRNAGLGGMMPRIIACGPRNDAFDSFMTARRKGQPAILLVDSEDPLHSDSPREHLEQRDGWSFEAVAADDHIHLMVQCMENWFLADKRALTSFFGQGFRVNALPQHERVEAVSKQDVLRGFANATAAVKTKGAYRKGAHSFKILATIDPQKVRQAAPHADRLLKQLAQTLS